MPGELETAGLGDYDQYNQQHQYNTVPGVVQVPVAGHSSQHRLIRLHGGYGTRTVKWTAARYGRPPVIPKADDADGDILLGTTIAPCLPSPNDSAAGFNWLITGEYTYAQESPRVPGTDTFPVGSFPFATPTQSRAAQLISGAAGAILQGVLDAAEQSGNEDPDFDTYYEKMADQVYDPETGLWSWPFLALPPTFSGATI